MTADVLVLSGAAGVGKTSVAHEVASQLRRMGVAHAVIDTDELDHVFPVPDDLPRLTERNLAAIWEGFRERGIHRLILVGVFMHRETELAWIRRAVGDARFTLIRLSASEAMLRERIGQREQGSDYQAQVERTFAQLRDLAEDETTSLEEIHTDRLRLSQIAAKAISLAGWDDASIRPS